MVAPLVAIAAAVAAAPGIIKGVEESLDAIGLSRSCIVEIVNATDEQLRLVHSGHTSGGYNRAPAPTIEPHTTMVFSSAGNGEGAVGYIGYEGNNIRLLMDWANALVGTNDLDASFELGRVGEFNALTEAGPGNTNARFRCIVSYHDLSRYILGPKVQLRSHNYPDRFIRHRNFLGELTPVDAVAQDFQFEVINRGPSLVGFRSVNFPDRYLRHQNFELKLQAPAGYDDALWGLDTTFSLKGGLAGDGESYQAVNYPDRFIRHRDFKLYVENGNTELAKADATFHRVALTGRHPITTEPTTAA